MEFLATYWIFFLVITVVLFIASSIFGILNVKKFSESSKDFMDNKSDMPNPFSTHMIAATVCMVLSAACALLTIVGIISNFVGN